MEINAKQILTKLIEEDKILTKKGQIRFHLGDVDIVVKRKDVVGNIMQEWMEEWMRNRGINFAVHKNTQMPPDFFLNREDRTKDMLEIKAFYCKQSPGFDIAAFRMFEREIKDKPFVLDTDYMIFGYDINDDGDVTIKNVWLKKVWEICRPMSTKNGIVWPLNLQINKGVVQKIRPGKWFGKQTKFQLFENKMDFVSAVEETVYKNTETHDEASSWKQEFLNNYKKHYGEDIEIPRWNDIKKKYVIV